MACANLCPDLVLRCSVGLSAPNSYLCLQDSFYRSLTQEEMANVKDYNFDHPGGLLQGACAAVAQAGAGVVELRHVDCTGLTTLAGGWRSRAVGRIAIGEAGMRKVAECAVLLPSLWVLPHSTSLLIGGIFTA